MPDGLGRETHLDRRRPVIAVAFFREQLLHDFFLQHVAEGARAGEGFEEAEHDGGAHVVGQVTADDVTRFAGQSGLDFGARDLEGVPRNQDETIRGQLGGETTLELFDHATIDLDGDDAQAAREQSPRQRARAGPDLDDAPVRFGERQTLDLVGDPRHDGVVHEKMLTEGLVGANHGGRFRTAGAPSPGEFGLRWNPRRLRAPVSKPPPRSWPRCRCSNAATGRRERAPDLGIWPRARPGRAG